MRRFAVSRSFCHRGIQRVLLVAWLAICGLVWLAAPAHAQPAPRVYVLTFGPGDHAFFKFGHNAIWIEPPTGGGAVYNFGTFAFDNPALIPKFIQGRFYYWLSVASIEDTLWSYTSSNRTIEAQELNLTEAQAFDLQHRLQINARPENREYLYDYFTDNCSTRVRDAIDGSVSGALKTALQAQPGRQTFRQHALRLVEGVTWEYVGLHFALSGHTDFAPNRWQETFVPQVLQRALREVKVQRDGALVPLVKNERVLFPAPGRVPPAEVPPARTKWFVLAGLLCALALYVCARLAVNSVFCRVVLGLMLSFGGLVFGFLGAFLLFVWLGTNHTSSQGNENILQTPLWLFGLVMLGVGVARGKARAYRRAQRLFTWAMYASLLGLALKVLPWFQQDNLPFILFFLPIWVAGTVGLKELRSAQRG
ncbi:MAG: DUF4105 domain-containing protein [Deltaproteobacteria bacterium]|nr:DUF4105 domain-containing protein [Deltaproteobacteria bacterium]